MGSPGNGSVCSCAAAPAVVMSSQNVFTDAFSYPSNTVEDYFKVSAFVLAGIAGLIYALEFSFSSLRKNRTLNYGLSVSLGAFKYFVLLGVTGLYVPGQCSDAQIAANECTEMVFPASFWFDAVIWTGITAEFFARLHGTKNSEQVSALNMAGMFSLAVGTALMAVASMYPGSRVEWIALPAIAAFSVHLVYQVVIFFGKSFRTFSGEVYDGNNSAKYDFYGKIGGEWNPAKGMLFHVLMALIHIAYLLAFILSNSYTKELDTRQTALFFMILDLTMAALALASKALPAYFEHASHKRTDKMMAEYSPASNADTF